MKNNNIHRISYKNSNHTYAITSHDSGIEIDINAVTREIKEQVEILVNEKLNDFGINQNTEKYSNVLVKNTKEGLLNYNQENTRDLNVIIHSVNESETTDDLFIKELFCITEVKTSSVMVHRLGQKKEDRSRPIKIVMAAKKHKADFMTKLLKLWPGS